MLIQNLVSTIRGMAARTAAVAGVMGVGGLALVFSMREPAPELYDFRNEEPTAAELAAASEPADFSFDPKAWDIANLPHDRVDFWVHRFQTDEDMREKFEGFLRRAGWYEDMIRQKLHERGMPQDLFYLAMIESGFQPKAYSHAAASGLWQFIAETGRRYGLRVDGEVDERNDPEKATEAALDYLQEMYERFDSWYLAAAGYNSGENRVARVMRERTGSERGSDADYYRVWDHLPRETRDYVPLMIAAARISKDRARYGFDHVEPEAPLEYEVTITDAGFTLATVAQVTGAMVSDLELLNPHLKRGRLPANERFALRLPVGTAEVFEANWATAVAEQVPTARTTVKTYRVRNGDNLTTIARRHGTTVRELRLANGLRSDRIYAGQVLKVED